MLIIVNADDFGRSNAINTAVLRAHHEGILTSASLMVTGAAFEEAVALARDTPSLAVGLHVVVTHGQSVLPKHEIPNLVDANGLFSTNPFRNGLLYAVSRKARQELARELAAQFERFAATGLPLSHVDGHLHMHLHPSVFNIVLPLAERHGARGVRVPRDDLWLALRHDWQRVSIKMVWAVVFGLLGRWCLNRLQGQRFVIAHRVYGLMQTGRMSEDYVASLLSQLSVPIAELFFHPTTIAESEDFGPNAGDLATLLSPAVRQVIRERGLELTTYPALYEGLKVHLPLPPLPY